MSFTFTEIKVLADGNTIRFTEAASGGMNFTFRIGAGALQTITLTAAEVQFIQRQLQYLTLARANDTL